MKALFYYIIAVIALAFYFIAFNTVESISGDEAYSIFNAQTEFKDIVHLSMADQNPPLYLFVLKIWIKCFGITEMAVRSMSALFMSSAIVLFFALLRNVFSQPVALITIFFLSVSYSIVYFAQEVRCYALLLLLCVISLHVLYSYFQHQRIYKLVLFSFISVLILLTHYLSVFFLLTVYVTVLFTKDKNTIVKFILTGLFMLLIISPWLIFVLNNMPKKGEFWLQSPSFNNYYFEWIYMFNSRAVFLFFILTLIGYGIYNIFFSSKVKIDSSFNWVLFFSLLSLLPSLMEFSLAQLSPMFIMRYYLYSILGVTAIISFIIYEVYVFNKWASGIMAIVLVVFLSIAYSIHPKKEENWKYIIQNSKDVLGIYPCYVYPSYKTKEVYYYHNRDYFKAVKTFSEKDETNKIYPWVNDTLQVDTIAVVLCLEKDDEKYTKINNSIVNQNYHELKRVEAPNYRGAILLYVKNKNN
ncbi:MAG: glycosyltransferase family 39 protein [Cytophagaceae bacterium]